MLTDKLALKGRSPTRTRVCVGLYCLAIFLVFDFVYSSVLYDPGSPGGGRTRNAIYDHGFVPNFAGIERWGRLSYWLYTNNLGLKDAAVRIVPPVSEMWRVLVIGDSFTEAIGLRFEDSFVGMLHQAGQGSTRKTESSMLA
jgi:hypothetical protein